MAETLVERVQKIERVPEYLDIDKDAEIRKAFEEYSGNTVVRAVMDGKSNFFKFFSRIPKRFRKLRFLEGFFASISA